MYVEVSEEFGDQKAANLLLQMVLVVCVCANVLLQAEIEESTRAAREASEEAQRLAHAKADEADAVTRAHKVCSAWLRSQNACSHAQKGSVFSLMICWCVCVFICSWLRMWKILSVLRWKQQSNIARNAFMNLRRNLVKNPKPVPQRWSA